MSLYRQRRKDLDGERIDDVEGYRVYHRAYEVSPHANLADVSLERGDTLPDAGETSAIIVANRFEMAKRKDGTPGLCKVARVTAVTIATK